MMKQMTSRPDLSDESTDSAGPQEALFNLTILNGKQAGMVIELCESRYLIGSDIESCDLVLETGTASPVVLTLLIADNTLAVQAIAGDCRLNGQPLVHFTRQAIALLDRVLIGDSVFVVAPRGQDVRPADLNVVAESVNPTDLTDAHVRKVSKPGLRAATGSLLAAMGVVAMVGGLAWSLGGISLSSKSDLTQTQQQMTQLEAALTSQGISEVSFKLEQDPIRVVASGFVASGDQLAMVRTKLQTISVASKLAVSRVDSLQLAIAQQLRKRVPTIDLKYLGNGEFILHTTADHYQAVKQQVSEVFRRHPAVNRLKVGLTNIAEARTGDIAMVVFDRLPGSTGRIDVRGEDLPLIAVDRPEELFVEVRQGHFPSVVTRDGLRYFEGAVLPDGSLLSDIRPGQIVLTKRNGDRQMALAVKSDDTTPQFQADASNFPIIKKPVVLEN